MTRKIISWLPLWAVFLLTLSSCVHDEVYSASDPDAEQYHSKSPFKEDEKYIKNVISVYEQNENRIKKISGTPLWDYATSMGNLDETYLIVPVADGRKVVACIQVPRSGDMVSFIYDHDTDHIRFFQAFINAKQVRPLKQSVRQNSSSEVSRICQVMAISMWYPDDNYVAGGYWETNVITKCENSGGTDPSDPNPGNPPTYPYPGGAGGGQNSPNPSNPCEKIKIQRTDANFSNKITDLQGKTALTKETGYIQKWGGSYEYKDNAGATSTSRTLKLPEVESNEYIKAYMHTHVNDIPNSTDKGIKMFSPADVVYFMDLVKNAQTQGQSLSDPYAVMVTSTGNYQIRFTGNKFQIKTFSSQEETYHHDAFIEAMQESIGNQKSLEMGFLKYIQKNMLLYGITVYRMNTGGTTTEIKLNADKTDTVESICPN